MIGVFQSLKYVLKKKNIYLSISFRSHSEVSIVRIFEGDFEECLHRHNCLNDGTLNFLNCLKTKCPIGQNSSIESSSLEKCLFDEEIEREKRSLFFINFGIRRGDIEVPDMTTPSGKNFEFSSKANF